MHADVYNGLEVFASHKLKDDVLMDDVNDQEKLLITVVDPETTLSSNPYLRTLPLVLTNASSNQALAI